MNDYILHFGIIVTVIKVKEGEMSRACSTNGGE
jgi:hypothetical protein